MIDRISLAGAARTPGTAQRAAEKPQQSFGAMLQQAARQAEPGYAFAEDSVWQSEFEESFPYQETDDQRNAGETGIFEECRALD